MFFCFVKWDGNSSLSSNQSFYLAIFLFRFLCEYIYYTSLKHSSSPVLFIHVPVLSQTITVNDIAKTITEIICCCLQQLWLREQYYFCPNSARNHEVFRIKFSCKFLNNAKNGRASWLLMIWHTSILLTSNVIQLNEAKELDLK